MTTARVGARAGALAGLLALACAATAGGTSAAAAVVPPAASIAVDPSGGHPLEAVTVRGAGFCGTCGPVQILVDFQPVGSATPAGDGTFNQAVQIPGTVRPEQIPIDATQTANSGTVAARTWFTVTVSGSDEGGDDNGGVNISRHDPAHRPAAGRSNRPAGRPGAVQRPVSTPQVGPDGATTLHAAPAADSRPIAEGVRLAGLLGIAGALVLFVRLTFRRRRANRNP